MNIDSRTMKNPIHSVGDRNCPSSIMASSAANSGSTEARNEALALC